MPQYKLDFGGTEYSWGLKAFNVKLRENNYSTATLVLENPQSYWYDSVVNTFTEVKLYVKDAWETAYTQIFGGYARELLPSLSISEGELLTVGCKGYGAALEETHCSRDYGAESSNNTIDTCKEIWDDLVTDFVNKSFDDWNTNHGILTVNGANDLIANIQGGTTISYINNPYRPNINVVNHVCELATAIAAGADAENPAAPGPHWIVDSTKHLIINTIGAHEDTAEWPDWWNTDQAGSTLVQGSDFREYQVIDKSSEFANNVVLATDFRRTAYDYWAADSALWGSDGLDELTNDAVIKTVGPNSLRFEYAVGQSEAYFPVGENAGWDVTSWGSVNTIPRLNFYFGSEDCGATTWLWLYSGDAFDSGNNFALQIMAFNDLTDDEWHFISIPVGPYWANDETSKMYPWTDNGGDWTDIDGFCFSGIEGAIANAKTWVDDIHFTGRITRSAYVSDNITANNEWQKVFLSRSAMDDSCIASDDSGDAGRIAKAELLRRIRNPRTIQFSTGMRKNMMAGQKLHAHAGLKADNASYVIDSDMRMMTVDHGFNVLQGAYTTVTATDDLYNTRPISSTDTWALQQEFTLINSGEAKNMRAGAEVDLFISMLKKDYT